MASNRRPEQYSYLPVIVAPTPPLTDADLAYMRRAVEEIAPTFSVELEGFCSHDASIVVVPEDGEDTTGPSFVISRDNDGLRVSQVQWDTPTDIGVFDSLRDVLRALQVRLTFCVDTTIPEFVTLH